MEELIRKNWTQILERVKSDRDLSNVSYDTWLKPLEVRSAAGNVVLIQCPFEKEMIDYIKVSYADSIKTAINEVTGISCDISFALEDQEKMQRIRLASLKAGLNPRYTFDTFVVGNNNKFAHAAALAVAEKPGESYNPLFLYGGVGLGKTHLMHSIAHYIIEHNPDMTVLYVTSEEFTNEVIEAIRSGSSTGSSSMTKFREKYRNIDVLLVDDVQFIIGKESTQEEFFHTFNALHSARKQIILSSDRPPKDMDILEERIRSRFEWGLMADIQKPDFETRMAILRKKQDLDGLYIPNDVIEYIATNIKSNIRELEGALNKVVALATLENRPVNLEITETALRDLISTGEQKKITPDFIIEVVADHFGITPEEMKSGGRGRKYANPKQIAMYLIYNISHKTYKEIAAMFGLKNHTTIINGCNNVEYTLEGKNNKGETVPMTDKMRENQEEMRNNIEALKKKLNQTGV